MQNKIQNPVDFFLFLVISDCKVQGCLFVYQCLLRKALIEDFFVGRYHCFPQDRVREDNLTRLITKYQLILAVSSAPLHCN